MTAQAIEPELEQIVEEDLAYLSSLIHQDTITNAELRRSSVVMRRLVCEDQLQRVASARRHEIAIAIPEARALIRSIESDGRVVFYQLGGYRALGIDINCFIIEHRGQTLNRPYDPNVTFVAPLKTYKRQPVFMVRAAQELPEGQSRITTIAGIVTRESVIKYVAHKTGGVHYDKKRTSKDDELLDIVRKALSMSMNGDIPTIAANALILEDLNARARQPLPGIGPVSKTLLDPVLLELLGAARMLVDSPSIQQLRALLGI
jgi:hypothetical protein